MVTYDIQHVWFYFTEGDPNFNLSAQLAQWGAAGYSVAGIAAHPDINWESPRLTNFAGSFSQGAWIHVILQRPTE